MSAPLNQDSILIHPNLQQLSHSSLVTLHRCPRKYELERLSARNDAWGEVHLDFGKVVGEAVQHYLTHRDINKARWIVYTGWKSGIEDGAEEGRTKANKTFWHALHALDRFTVLLHSHFAEYEVVWFNSPARGERHACELGFSVDCGAGYTYRGFIDCVLRHKRSGKIIVVEFKTTSSWSLHEATYKNSGQALGYSLVLDRIAAALGIDAGASYQVYYPVYKTKEFEWEVFDFNKTHTSRALWIKQLLCDLRHVQEYHEDNYFPIHGESCMDFNRPCDFFGVCEMQTANLIRNPIVKVEPEDKYDFHFSLADIIQAQLEALE
jgi:hypothetical protein